MEITNRIVYLLHKHVRQELNAEELTELEAWSNRHPTFRQLLDEVSDEKSLTAALQAFDQVYGDDPAASIARMEGRIADGIQAVSEMPFEPIRARRLRTWLPYAAALLIITTIATYFFLEVKSNREPQVVDLKTEDIAPGGNRATLRLADGRTIDLNQEQTGIQVGDGITYLDGSEVVAPNSHTEYAILTTPKGGTYQITLSDGSKIWLNAASTLTYPVSFDDEERVVELEGEGYFEVASDEGRPFKVISKGQEAIVLGTEFNVSAYDEENEIKTTLVEGSVRLDIDGASLQLGPGEQGIVDGNGLNKHHVNIEQHTSWKSGRFSFEGKTFDQVFRELARWYDIDIRYDGPIPDVEFYGGAFRNKNLGVVLRLLESARLSYHMEGRMLVINTKRRDMTK